MKGKDPLLGVESPPPGRPARPPADPALVEIRRRQRTRATIMAVLLFAFVILVFWISIVRMSMGQ